MKSAWTDNVSIQEFKTLEDDIKTDVLIIGGGIAGILCAYFLKQAGVNYVLAEANRIGCGITKNTTAKITSQHGLIYDKLIKNVGIEKAKMYLESNQLAVQKYRELCKNISCSFEEKNSYVYTINNRNKIEKELSAMDKLGFNADFEEKIQLPFAINGSIKFKGQAQFNPLQFLSSICSELNIYENTFVKEIENNIAKTDKGNITAKKLSLRHISRLSISMEVTF